MESLRPRSEQANRIKFGYERSISCIASDRNSRNNKPAAKCDAKYFMHTCDRIPIATDHITNPQNGQPKEG